MFVPEVLRRIKSADQVEIISDNAVRPHVAVSDSAPVVGISRYPRTLERIRKGRSSQVWNRWENATPANPKRSACFPPRTLVPSEGGRSTWVPRGTVAVPENDSIQDIHHSPQQEKMAVTFTSDCLRTLEASKKRTVTSKPFQKTPTQSTFSSTSTARGSFDPIFSRWDSTPLVYKHLKSEPPSAALSLRSCAERTARTLKKPARGGLIMVHIPDKLHKDPDLILSPPKKPVRRRSFESNKEQDSSDGSSTLSDTASLLEEALRITAETQFESVPFGTNGSNNDTCDDCQPSLPLALPL